MDAFVCRTIVLAGLMMTAPGVAFSQLPPKSPAFDVASIRPNVTGANGSSISRSGGRITLENVTLRECVAFAFHIPTGTDYELSGPGFLDTEKFDIAATFPLETSRERVLEMLQTMLVERFKLQTHTENKNLDSYALVVAKRGPKLHAVSTASDGAFIWGDGQLTARAISMAALADRLSGPVFKLGRPVVDMTRIEGTYDFILNWAPDDAPDYAPAALFTALEEQLGLKLEARKLGYKILVVDHAEKAPLEN